MKILTDEEAEKAFEGVWTVVKTKNGWYQFPEESLKPYRELLKEGFMMAVSWTNSKIRKENAD